MAKSSLNRVLKPRDPSFNVLAGRKGGAMTSPSRKQHRREQRILAAQISEIKSKGYKDE